MEIYTYETLNRNEIRLLEIFSSQEESESIQCRIIRSSLDDRPTYDALSYVWGDPSRVKNIFVDGKSLGVTANLFEALSQLQHLGSEFSSESTGTIPDEELVCRCSYLWVDAISINQEDLAERNSQVQMMGLIYQQATRVLVWLGTGLGSNNEAFNVLKKMARLNRNPEELLQYNPSELSLSQITDFQMFARNPWFNRIWVVQEVVMCLNETIFIHGRQLIRLEELDSAASILTKPLYPSGIEDARSKNFPGVTDAIRSHSDHVYKWTQLVKVMSNKHVTRWVDEVKILSALQARRRGPGVGIDLEYLLCHLTERHSTDPRDMIYALLGMCKASRASISNQSYEHDGSDDSKLIVDYGATLLDVYSSVVDAVVCATGKVNIICAIAPRDSSEWPSWVPNWSRKGTPESPRDGGLLTKGNFLHTNEVIELVDNSNILYDAAKQGMTSLVRLNKTLIVQGVIWDTIESGWPSRTHTRHRLSNFSETLYLHLIQVLQKDDFRVYGTAPKAEEAIWRTLVTNREDELAFNEAPAHWVGRYRQWVNDEGNRIGRDHFRIAMAQHLSRNFVISARGYFGLASRRSLPGDRIAVILGCSVPVVLRKVDQGYRVIGDVYVHGIMKGEVMDETQKGEVKLDGIRLV